jgi:hypothetical protein
LGLETRGWDTLYLRGDAREERSFVARIVSEIWKRWLGYGWKLFCGMDAELEYNFFSEGIGGFLMEKVLYKY